MRDIMTREQVGRTVLVADDDEDIRMVVSEAIARMGMTVVQAPDGSRACSLADDIEFDLAVLDLTMPGATGLEVCRHIKTKESGKLTPVLILTAKDNVEDKVSALDVGADDYLTKPFHYKELQARVRAFLRIRELNVDLHHKNQVLVAMQEKIVQQERQLVAGQIGGTAAHQLGQPLSALMLNLYLIEQLSMDDPRYRTALEAMKADSKRMTVLIEQLRSVDATQSERYHNGTTILSLEKK